MPSNEQGRELHDRATLGHSLTATEQEALAQWYVEQDEAEGALLSASRPTTDLSKLRANVERSLQELRAVTGQVENLTLKNAELREKVNRLQQRLRETAVAGSI